MKITISYDSCWRNSFLDGDNNESLPKKGRKYIASMTSLKNEKNFIKREISKNTVMGVLNRLIGDQRKLYKSSKSKDYYFADIEDKVSFNDNPETTQEMTYLRNISNGTDKNSFTGAIKSNDIRFNSDYSKEFWGVLNLNLNELMEFILNKSFIVNKDIGLYPTSITSRVEELLKIKLVENNEFFLKIIDTLNNYFPDNSYVEKNGKIKLMRLYAASLYIQCKRLKNKFDMSSILSARGTINGFSKRNYNGKRDFMVTYTTTGKPKIIFGNPYIHEPFVKGQGKIKKLMTKASGTLNINIDINRDKAKEIRTMINNAGVSSFYLGKKVLAFVDGEISIKEIKK
jgi:YHS domain-containing protein